MAVWSFQVWTRKVSFANTVGENKNHIAQQTHVRQTYFQRAFLVWKSQSWVYKLRVLVYIRFFLFSFFNFFSLTKFWVSYIRQTLWYTLFIPFVPFWNFIPFTLTLSLSLSLSLSTMSEAKTQIESLRTWVVEHKLRTVGKFLSIPIHLFR